MLRWQARIALASLWLAAHACSEPGPVAPPELGSLRVTISGLPTGTAAAVNVQQSGQTPRIVNATSTLTDLPVGTYTVTAAGVSLKDGAYLGTPASQTVTVTTTTIADASVAFAFVPSATLILNAIVDSIRNAFGLPALGGAIVTLNNAHYARGVAGMRRVNAGPPVTATDLWHLGSNFKAFTAMLAAIAVDGGYIQWTTTVGAALSDMGVTIRSEYQPVTLRDLLAQRSGFPRDPPRQAITGATRPQQRTAVAQWAVQQAPVTQLGRYYYSNTNYIIAALMLERAFGASFEDAMQARVFQPLDVRDAGYGPQAAAGSTLQPAAHYWENGWVVAEGYDNPPVYASAGGAHMSIASWAKFLQEVLRVEAGSPTIVSTTAGRATTASTTPIGGIDSYGLGWVITDRSWALGKTLVHDGTNGANASVTWMAPVRGFAVLALTNSFDGPSNRVAEALDVLSGRLIAFYETGR